MFIPAGMLCARGAVSNFARSPELLVALTVALKVIFLGLAGFCLRCASLAPALSDEPWMCALTAVSAVAECECRL